MIEILLSICFQILFLMINWQNTNHFFVKEDKYHSWKRWVHIFLNPGVHIFQFWSQGPIYSWSQGSIYSSSDPRGPYIPDPWGPNIPDPRGPYIPVLFQGSIYSWSQGSIYSSSDPKWDRGCNTYTFSIFMFIFVYFMANPQTVKVLVDLPLEKSQT